jgi:hypothetical protein
MKTALLFSTLLAFNFSAHASIYHTCTPTKSNPDISRVTLNYINSDHMISIFDASGAVITEVVTEYYDDMTYIAYVSNKPELDLTFWEKDANGTWIDATLDYGPKLEKRLNLTCY